MTWWEWVIIGLVAIIGAVIWFANWLEDELENPK